METKILVIGVGGAGCNVVDKVADSIRNYDYVNNIRIFAVNTDRQSLSNMKHVDETITLGKKGRGAGSDPDKGRIIALRSIEEGVFNKVRFDEEISYDLIIIVAGLGGGTGTGAGPVIADHLKKVFDTTVLSVLILPDRDEYGDKTEIVNRGIIDFYKVSDSIAIIDNSEVVDHEKPLHEAYDGANEFIKNIIVTLLDICEKYGNPNIDFADIEAVLTNRNRLSKFVFIGSVEFLTVQSVENLPLSISTLKRQTAVTSFRGAKYLLAAFFHSGKLSSQKAKSVVESIKNEILQGGNSPYVKRGDYIDLGMKEQVKIGVVVAGIQVDNRISKLITENIPDMLVQQAINERDS